MYFGHYAVASAIKAKEPDIPAAPLLLGTGFLDIMNGAFFVNVDFLVITIWINLLVVIQKE